MPFGTYGRMKRATRTALGVESLDHADVIAKRYALWSVRRDFDWGSYLAGIPDDARLVNSAMTAGIFELDVRLRKDVEYLLLNGGAPDEAVDLREQVNEQVQALAHAIERSRHIRVPHPEWPMIVETFGETCEDLGRMLTLAGAPRTNR
jgi:hypothetical protein